MLRAIFLSNRRVSAAGASVLRCLAESAPQVLDTDARQREADLFAQQLDERAIRRILDAPLEHLTALESLRILPEATSK